MSDELVAQVIIISNTSVEYLIRVRLYTIEYRNRHATHLHKEIDGHEPPIHTHARTSTDLELNFTTYSR